MKKRRFVFTLIFLLLLSAPVRGEVAPEASPTVVIDPGHGGWDGGAVGERGTREKDIVLEVALRLADSLEGKGFRVLLTRKDDTYIPLKERTAFANSNGAHIFISIHANSASRKGATGVETYFLSYEATDDEARRVSELENSIIPEEELLEFTDDLKDILLDLTMNFAHHESGSLAEAIHSSVIESTGKVDRGVKQAPFFVLWGARMPAVLVEVGFLSNPDEEAWLTSEKRLSGVAEAIAAGVLNFKDTETAARESYGFRKTEKD